MKPKEVINRWIDAYNDADAEALADLYDENAINYQVSNKAITGRAAIKKVFADDFTGPRITCIVENIFEDGQWAILEWKEPKGMSGCDFFQIVNGKILCQRAYWDALALSNTANTEHGDK